LLFAFSPFCSDPGVSLQSRLGEHIMLPAPACNPLIFKKNLRRSDGLKTRAWIQAADLDGGGSPDRMAIGPLRNRGVCQDVGMGLSNAERQARWREKRNALAEQSPSELVRRLRDLDKRKLSKELSELAAAYRQYAAALMRVVRGLRSRRGRGR
jgi:hypothetical protein